MSACGKYAPEGGGGVFVKSLGWLSHLVPGKAIAVSVLAVIFAVIAVPVYGNFQLHGFFSPSNKYRAWFDETAARRALLNAPGFRRASAVSTAVKYPYPDKDFVMTEAFWKKSSNAIADGKSDWFDTEIVRQRAEVEKYAPAMDLLGWMYQEGRGLNRDYRKAFMWYERAKLAGMENLRGSSTKIFNRLSESDRAFAESQLADDIKRLRSEALKGVQGQTGYSSRDFERIKLHILRQQNDFNFFKNKKNGVVQRKADAARR